MDEARAVLARLDRIDELESSGAPAGILLAEVRALLCEAEAWVRAEPIEARDATKAITRCRGALDRGTVGEFADQQV
ncbi:MAG: hypothetical protein C5B48_11705 [Candidatus Rokuibacteriota bacterium]|nr:MAG: hypothetical protein C5B48_11705 [Candidatus Rokubacteria bacterium]